MGLPGRRIRVSAAIAVAAVLIVGAHAQAAPPTVSIFEIPGKVRGKIHTDGNLTVGQQETVSVTGLPGKFRLRAYVFPQDPPKECFQFKAPIFCEPQPLFRVPGTRRFRSSKKGRATLTSVMPPGYQVNNFKDPLRSHPIYFVNGQTIRVHVYATYRERRRGRLAEITSPVGSASALVEVPPAS